MSREQFQKPYKQRFKGVETFLRRVAFNLGNTASQTEVKIISCIPIDVTDLQQKIISLEKQLHEAQQQGASVDNTLADKASKRPSAVVNTALYGSTFAKQSSTVSYCSNKPIETIKSGQVATCCGSFSSRAKKSNVSFVFPALSAPDTKKSSDFNPRKGFSNDNAAAIERCKNIFRKRKRKKVYRGNSKMKTHLVYYAQTDNPYNVRKLPVSKKCNVILNSNDKLCMSHINNVIRRQYDPNEVVEELSDTSNFSRPICRDIENKCKHFNHYDSDVCSCCHGKFQNIDNYMTKTNYDFILTKLHNSLDNTKVYYDSNQYDMIPVKENNNKLIKYNVEQKKDNKRLEIKCWPEPLRTKPKCIYPFIVNYNTETPAKRKLNTRPQPTLIHERNKQQKVNIDPEKIRKSEQKTSSGTSKSCYIDCSDIYPKQELKQLKPRKTDIVKSATRKNESVETDEVITKLVSNQSTQLELIENCKEITLNEIKTILQSVLEEVKTNVKHNNIDETLKRDAVVQKGESQNSLPGDSTLLHSYTYNNSYNANPYAPSCSKQLPDQYYVPNIPCQPVKCLQNFPVFIQPTSGRHLCTCYYRKGCKPHNKPEATAPSNTAPNPDNKIDMSPSRETEKLIKEIYKSIALNMDFPTKDSSTSEYNDLRSDKLSTNVMDVKNMEKDMSNKRNDKIETTVQPTTNKNIIDGTAFNTLAGDAKQVIKPRFIKAESTGNINKDKYVHRLELNSIPSADTIIENEEDEDECTVESNSTSTVVLEELKQHKKRNKGFFSRMLKSVKLFKKKKQTQDEKEASDSDDYETIYSEKSATISSRYYRREDYIKPKNFDANKRNRNKHSPYLEQEYRRHWNERLAFREQESKCTSERPVSRHSSVNQTRPIFWNNYEARSAIVNHKLPNQLKTNDTQKHIKYDYLQRNDSVQKINKGFGWLKKHKFGINCGEQWKKFIFEN